MRFPWEQQAESVQEQIEKYKHIFNKLTPPPQA
jgi:preprotein translocase subunit Sss1